MKPKFKVKKSFLSKIDEEGKISYKSNKYEIMHIFAKKHTIDKYSLSYEKEKKIFINVFSSPYRYNTKRERIFIARFSYED